MIIKQKEPCHDSSRQITIISYISLMNKGKLKKKWKVPRYCFFVHGLNISFSRCKRYQFFVFLAWHPNRYRGCSDCGPSEAEHLKKYQTLAATPQAFHTGTLPPHPTRYFHEFAPDSHETLHVCLICILWHGIALADLFEITGWGEGTILIANVV